MIVEILTPNKTIFSGNASSIKLPGIDGSFAILENHAPLVAALAKGKVQIISDDETLYFEIAGGVVEVLKNKVEVLAG
ncbi:MAG: ATP synthase F1 subunit epsilon [Bacteroidetes bacterium]|nr:ATP synthase F1 subunit epsilon [Bacteroidota bacterium]MCL2303414.1 ATP synthase F1 subunit epsilon [Lentimicrobiaceae bacterium]